MSIRNLEDGSFTFDNINVNTITASGAIQGNTINSVANTEIGGGLRFTDGQYVEYDIGAFTCVLGNITRLDRSDVSGTVSYGGPDPAASWTAGSLITFAKDGIYLVNVRFTATVPPNTELNVFIADAAAVPATSKGVIKVTSPGSYSISAPNIYEVGVNQLQVSFDCVDLGGGADADITSGKLQFVRLL